MIPSTAHVLPSCAIELEVPFADTDCQKIVWHGNYLRYFELARVQLFAQCDLFSLVEEGKVNFVVSESYCKHYHPLRFRDRCKVHVTFVDIDHRLNMRFLITKDDGTKVAKGHTHIVSLDGHGKLQLVTPPSVTERILSASPGSKDVSASRRSFIVATAALLGLLLDTHPARAEPPHLPASVLRVLEQHKKASGLYARFVEEKHIALLKVPLRNEGFLAYLRPDQFARVVEKPQPSKIVAKGNRLAFREGQGPKTELSLENRPELRALVDGIMLLLSGDLAQIQERYVIKVETCKDSCRVELHPKDQKMLGLIKKFVIEASPTELVCFEVHERSGDYSVTKLKELELDRAFSEEEKRTLFTI